MLRRRENCCVLKRVVEVEDPEGSAKEMAGCYRSLSDHPVVREFY